MKVDFRKELEEQVKTMGQEVRGGWPEVMGGATWNYWN